MNSYSKEHYTTKVGKLMWNDYDVSQFDFNIYQYNAVLDMMYDSPVWFATIYPEPRSSMDEWDDENAIQAIKIAEEKLHHLFITIDKKFNAIQEEEQDRILVSVMKSYYCKKAMDLFK